MFRMTQNARKSVFFVFLLFTCIYGNRSACGQTPQAAQIDQSGKVHPWTHINWNNDPENFQFVIVSDRTGAHRDGIFEQAIEKINILQPEFVMCIGDLIEGLTEDIGQIRKEWSEFDNIIAQLEMPFFFVPGNHDVGGKELVKIWKERFGTTYYHFVYRNVLFLCLNSEGDETDEDEPPTSKKQVEYVKETLKAHPDVRWTVVFMHRPLWRSGRGRRQEQTGWEEIEAALKNRKHTIFAGHTHTYNYQTRHNQDYVTLATTGGGISSDNPFMKFDHVLWVTMTDNGPILANLMLSGIWDKDFTKEDVQDYLTVITSDKAVRFAKKDFGDHPQKDQPLVLRLFNSQDIPMEITLTFDETKLLRFEPAKLTKTLPPNTTEMCTFQLVLHKDQWPDVSQLSEEEQEDDPEVQAAVEQLWPLRVRWNIIYDFDIYGEIDAQGSRELF